MWTLLIGVAVGLVIGYLWAMNRCRKALAAVGLGMASRSDVPAELRIKFGQLFEHFR